MRLYEQISISFIEGITDRTGAKTTVYLSCTMIFSVDLARYGISRAKDWVSVYCGTSILINKFISLKMMSSLKTASILAVSYKIGECMMYMHWGFIRNVQIF